MPPRRKNQKKAKVYFLEKTKTRTCLFCKRSTEDEVDFGGLKSTNTNFNAHYYCLLFSETIIQSGTDSQGILGFLVKDILTELSKSNRKQCYYCNEFGATLGCARKNCSRKYHLPCGLMRNIQLNFTNYTSLCHTHRKVSNVPAKMKQSLTDYHCVICVQNFAKDTAATDVIWADCCKSEILLHVHCMKQMALSAGYFTKCPGCNNRDDFVKIIKTYGVFVPERDASWELCANAYSELLYVHKRCDVTNCLCPQGREYITTSGKWKIRLCKLCGSFGTHQFCSKSNTRVICDFCDVKTPTDAVPVETSTSWSEPSTSNEGNAEDTKNDSECDRVQPFEFVSLISDDEENDLIDVCSEDALADTNVGTDLMQKNLELLQTLPKTLKVTHIKTEPVEPVELPPPELEPCPKKIRQVAVKSTTQIGALKRPHEATVMKEEEEEENKPPAKRLNVEEHPDLQQSSDSPEILQSINTLVQAASANRNSPLPQQNARNKCNVRLSALINKIQGLVSQHQTELHNLDAKMIADASKLLEENKMNLSNTNKNVTNTSNTTNPSYEIWVDIDNKAENAAGAPPLKILQVLPLGGEKSTSDEVIEILDDDEEETDWTSTINITDIRTVEEDDLIILE